MSAHLPDPGIGLSLGIVTNLCLSLEMPCVTDTGLVSFALLGEATLTWIGRRRGGRTVGARENHSRAGANVPFPGLLLGDTTENLNSLEQC